MGKRIRKSKKEVLIEITKDNWEEYRGLRVEISITSYTYGVEIPKHNLLHEFNGKVWQFASNEVNGGLWEVTKRETEDNITIYEYNSYHKYFRTNK